MLITEDAAQTLLAPYHDAFLSSIHAAFGAWMTNAAPGLPHARGRTQANYMQDKIETLLRERLGSTPAVEFARPGRDRFWMIVRRDRRRALVRIKKLNTDFTTNNVRTETAVAFDRQMDLDHVPKGARITLGYRLDAHGQSLVDVWILLLDGQHVLWKYEIASPNPGGGAVVVPQQPKLPFPATGTRLKLKPTARRNRSRR
jgi:hypothetical protein